MWMIIDHNPDGYQILFQCRLRPGLRHLPGTNRRERTDSRRYRHPGAIPPLGFVPGDVRSAETDHPRWHPEPFIEHK
jgi:hypothetical protein